MGRWRKPGKSDASRPPSGVGPSEPDADRRSDVRPTQRESALWASRFSMDPNGLVTVSMAKTSLTDDDAERWCGWLRGHLGGRGATLSLVDFAENRLTARGVRHLLETFLDLQLPVQVLKLHHNRIAEGTCFSAYLQRGWLHELHLSHNELDAQASAAIIEAAVQARNANDNAAIYPRKVGKGNSAPLWVRLEQNFIDPKVFSSILDAKFGEEGRQICCDARSKWCTPHNCVQQAAFTVHLKNLSQQRRRGATTDAPATGSITRKADGTECAHVLCFDWSSGSWVPETIEIPAVDTSAAELSEGLKVLIGAGGMRRPEHLDARDGSVQTLSHEEGQTMGADLLRSIRNDAPAPVVAAPVVAAPVVAAPVAPPVPTAHAAVAAAHAQAAQAAAAAQVAQVAQAQAAAQAAAQVHLARVAAAHLLAAVPPQFEDRSAWVRLEAPVFRPGARCFYASSETDRPTVPTSAETSAGAASDDTESLEVTAGISAETIDGEQGPADSPAKSTRMLDDRPSPAVWLSKAAPLLEELPETSLWRKMDAQDAKDLKDPKSLEPELVAQVRKGSKKAPVCEASQGPIKEEMSEIAPKSIVASSENSSAQWLSTSDTGKVLSDVPDNDRPDSAKAPDVSPQNTSPGLAESFQTFQAVETKEATAPEPPEPAPETLHVPPEIEKPLVLHEEIPEEIPEVVGPQRPEDDREDDPAPVDDVAPVLVEDVAAVSVAAKGELEEVEEVTASEDEAPEKDVAREHSEAGETFATPTAEAAPAAALLPESLEESAAPSTAAEYPALPARVHQVFNILDDETRGRSRSDSSPRVLEVWKVAPQNSPKPTEPPKQPGQCHVM